MPDPSHLPVALREERERTIRVLCDHFALDHLEVAEFERRLDDANRAQSLPVLRALTADLPVAAQASAPAPASVPASMPAPRGTSLPPAPYGQRARQVIVGLMGGATRRGRWAPAQQSTAVGIMGGVLLDFREAQLPPGETVVHAFAFMGGVSIIVPPGLDVTVDGVGIMGGFDHLGQTGARVDPSAARLHINGLAIMGGVDVRVRTPGEPTAWDPHGGGANAREARREAHRKLREEAHRLRDEWRGRR
jgi:hypothetical protein